MGQNKNRKNRADRASEKPSKNQEAKRTEREVEEKDDRRLDEYGQITLENNQNRRKIQLLGMKIPPEAARPPNTTMCSPGWPALRTMPAWRDFWFS